MKSYVAYRMASLPMIGSDLEGPFGPLKLLHLIYLGKYSVCCLRHVYI